MRRVLLISLCIFALFLTAFVGKASAGNNTYCNMWNVGQQCVTPWNYNWKYTAHNGGTSGGVIFCEVRYPNGSRGAYSYLPSSSYADFVSTSYSRMICTMTSGPGGFPIAIYSYT